MKKIRAGFILLQAGMALGLIKDCIDIMDEVDGAARPRQPLSAAAADPVPRTPFRVREGGDGSWRAIPIMPTTAIGAASSRCACGIGDAGVAAAHAAMLHCGARGYLKSHRAQRRLREAYFVAIVTPATKQLRKMLAGDGT